MEQLAHDGDDGLLWLLSVGDEPVGEGLGQGVEDPRGHGGHEEPAPQLGRPGLGDGSPRLARGAAYEVARREPRPGGELARAFVVI